MFCVSKWTIWEFPKQTKATEIADPLELFHEKAEKSSRKRVYDLFGFLKTSHNNIWVLSALSGAAAAATTRNVCVREGENV